MEKSETFENIYIAIPKPTLDLLLSQGKIAADLVAVYTFYLYTAKWQRTNRPHATVPFVAKGLSISDSRVRKARGALHELGLIQDIHTHPKQKAYVEIRFVIREGTLSKIVNGKIMDFEKMDSKKMDPKKVACHFPEGKCLNNNIKCLNNNIKCLNYNRKMLKKEENNNKGSGSPSPIVEEEIEEEDYEIELPGKEDPPTRTKRTTAGAGKCSNRNIRNYSSPLLDAYRECIGSPDYRPSPTDTPKFKLAEERMQKFFSRHPHKFPPEEQIKLLFRALRLEHLSYGRIIKPGHLCSDNTWNLLMPAYVTQRFGGFEK